MTQPILLSIRTDPWVLPFSLDFYKEFFRRYPADAALFMPLENRGNCPYGATVYSKEVGEEVAPDWVLASPMLECVGDPVFYNRRTNAWCVPSAEKTWRADDRIHSLVHEMGIKHASGPETRLTFEILPQGVDWTVHEMENWDDTETVSWDIPWETLVADLRDKVLGIHRKMPRSVITNRILTLPEHGGSTLKTLREDLQRSVHEE